MKAIYSNIKWILKANLRFYISVTMIATANLLTYLWSVNHALQCGAIGFLFWAF